MKIEHAQAQAPWQAPSSHSQEHSARPRSLKMQRLLGNNGSQRQFKTIAWRIRVHISGAAE
ncbi:MAG: hypothetical protein B6D41_04720 [Chloroflexi bacterium UTCFX4]|nr:MAG: hypothetical protein B6D41_04720 [Chloroflexi bacterium UTCFX4]